MRPERQAASGVVVVGLTVLLLSVCALSPATAQTSPSFTVTSRSPQPGAVILERRPAIAVAFDDPRGVLDPKSVAMEVDSIDVTLLIKVEAGRVIYAPAADLVPGEHTVKLEAADKSGAALQPVVWKFKIRRFAAVEDAKVEGALTGSYERVIQQPKKEPRPDSGVSPKTETPLDLFRGNLRVDGLLKEGDFTAKLNSNVRYVDEFRPRPRPKTNNDKLDLVDYLVTLDKKPLTFWVGDVVVNEGFFGAPNVARRGMQFEAKDMENMGLKLNLFGTRYESVRGHDPFLGVEDDKESLLWGGALTWAPFSNRDWLKLHGLNVRGHRLSTAPGVNVGGVVSGEEGEVWSFGTTSTLFEGRLKLGTEVAISKFDTNTADEFSAETDKAYRGTFEGMRDVAILLDSPVMVRVGGEYSHVGFRFKSPANPGIQPDREGYSLREDAVWKLATLSLGYSTFNDNTDRLPNLARVRTHTWTTGLALAPPNLPSLALNYSFADQRSSGGPATVTSRSIDNFQHTYGFTTSYGKEAWSANVGGSVNYFQDETSPQKAGDKVTWIAQTSVMLKPLQSLSVNPSFSYSLIDDQDRTVILPDTTQVQRRVYSETLTATLALTQELIPKILNLDIQVSGTSTKSSDDSVDNQTYGGVGRLTWNVGNLFWDWGRQALSFRMNFNRVKDHVVPRDKTEIGVFLILDLLAPYSL